MLASGPGARAGAARGLIAIAISLAVLVPASASANSAVFTARGSVEQVYVVGLPRGAPVTLSAGDGARIASIHADSLGGALFRGVPPGTGYRVQAGGSESGPLTVLSMRPAPPSTQIFRQRIPSSGYGYLSTRDGTELAIDVRLPGPVGAGPYPTLVEYAGYGYADPYNGPDSGIAPIANLLGFAVVDVNMRGTGCSGGAFDYFEPLQSLDGYDAVETVARQPWVLHHKVGMLGISYGGISQLFVAATDPPDLAAITPLSVTDDTAKTLYPGGILNTGFGLAWARERAHDAEPAAPGAGEPWALERIRDGDRTCKADQVLHGEAVNEVAAVYASRYYMPSVANPLAPITFVHRIDVPVFLACQWTDEQVGASCPELASHLTGTRWKWFTFTNGDHIDSLDPATLVRWYDFLELFVARRAPRLSGVVTALAPVLYELAMGVSGVTAPDDPIQAEPTYAAALAAFERQPPVRILFDSGAGGAAAGAPVPAFEQSFARFPIQGTQARSWYLSAGGALLDATPPRAGSNVFTWNQSARPATSFRGIDGPGGLWGLAPTYDWAQNPAGTAVSYLTAPLRENTVVIGGGSLRAWIRASVPDVDLQVTISEVRPDGKETFVQDGWLRASERKLAPGSTLLAPRLTLRQADAAPLPAGRFTQVTVPLYDEGHVYRTGSRIRVTISAPGGDQPLWAFADPVPTRTAPVTIAYSSTMPSRLTLPVVPGVAVPTGLPPCPGLRGEPCRAYLPVVNRIGA
jgi:predicted acyl esterase